MPVILKTQHTLLKPSPWSAFSFRHEIEKRPETRMPKQRMGKSNRSTYGPFITRDSGETPASVVEGQTIGRAPTNLVPYIPPLLSSTPMSSTMSIDQPLQDENPFDDRYATIEPIQAPPMIPKKRKNSTQEPSKKKQNQTQPENPFGDEYAVPGGFPSDLLATENTFDQSVAALETAITMENPQVMAAPSLKVVGEKKSKKERPSPYPKGEKAKQAKKEKKATTKLKEQLATQVEAPKTSESETKPILKKSSPKFNVPQVSGVKRPGEPMESARVGKMPVPKNVPRVAGKKRPGQEYKGTVKKTRIEKAKTKKFDVPQVSGVKRPGEPMESARVGKMPVPKNVPRVAGKKRKGGFLESTRSAPSAPKGKPNPLGLKIDTSDRVTRTPAGNPKGMRGRKKTSKMEPDLTNITAANVVSGKRRGK
jgi:hypothetical protein